MRRNARVLRAAETVVETGVDCKQMSWKSQRTAVNSENSDTGSPGPLRYLFTPENSRKEKMVTMDYDGFDNESQTIWGRVSARVECLDELLRGLTSCVYVLESRCSQLEVENKAWREKSEMERRKTGK